MIKKLPTNNITSKYHNKEVTNTINLLIQEINKLNNISFKGSKCSIKKTSTGISLSIGKSEATATSGVDLRIAYIISPMTGGGYYNCVLEDDLLSANWNSSTTLFDHDTGGDTVEVLNINEETTNEHFLNAGAFIICWEKEDDGDTKRYIGFAPFGKIDFAEWS